MKRLFIVGLSLAIVGLLLRWLAPGIIYNQLAQQLAKHNAELSCLEWHIDGFQQLSIEHLCVSYQGISAEAHSVDVTLMQATFWQNDFDWKNLVPAITAKKLKIVLPEKVDLGHPQNTSTSDTTSGIPIFWLPDVAIERIAILSTFIDKELAFSLDLSQEKQQRILHLTSLDVEESARLSVSQRQQELQFEWRFDLPWLYDSIQAWAPLFAPVPETFEAISISSGVSTGQLALDASKPEQFQSTLEIINFNGQINHDALTEPLRLASQQHFQINRQDELISVNIEEAGNTHLSNFDAIAKEFLEIYQWQDIKLKLQSNDIPEQMPLNIALPSNVEVRLDDAGNGIAHIQANNLIVSNDKQQMQFSELSWHAETGDITSNLHLDNRIFLEKQNEEEQSHNSNQISTQLTGFIQTDLISGRITIEQLDIEGFGFGSGKDSVIELPQSISWIDTELSGKGSLQWQDQNWRINADYQVKLSNLQADLITFYDVVSEGRLTLNDEELKSVQTLNLDPNISLQISTGGNIQQLTIDAILPDAQLSSLNALIQEYAPDASLTEGVVSAAITSTLNAGVLETAEIDLIVENAAGSWQDYQFTSLNTAIPLNLNQVLEISAQPKQLQITELYVGTPITNINSRFLISGSIDQPQFQLQQLSGEVFHGNFVLQQLNYPLTLNSEALLRIERFNLDELVNLFGDQGIDITGSVSGEIPLSFSEGLVSVEQAIVKADTHGRLSIQDNAAFQDLKNSQGTLGIALTLLEELNYTTLQSEVHLEPDGWMTLGVNITGVNPQQEQPINFNPTLTTNLFTGLKALRAGQNVADTIEQQLKN